MLRGQLEVAVQSALRMRCSGRCDDEPSWDDAMLLLLVVVLLLAVVLLVVV